MKLKEDGDSLMSTDKLLIRDTKELTAKRLLTLFMAEYSPLEEIMERSEEVKAINTIYKMMNKCGIKLDLIDKAQSLPWIVCHCFYEFLAESPHIHVTID